MTLRLVRSIAVAVLITGALTARPSLSAQGQQARPEPAPPRSIATSAWTGPPTPDGQPKVEGIWSATLSGTYSLTNPTTGGAAFTEREGGRTPPRRPSRIIDPADGSIPYQPWAADRQKRQAIDIDYPTDPEHLDTQTRCLVGGVPRPFYNTRIQILQPAGTVLFLSEQYHSSRMVFLDGRAHVGTDIKLWMGDSVGRWDGNTLNVDVTNLNGKPRLSMVGDFLTSAAHVVERLVFTGADTMNYEATITDPNVFTRPWTMVVAMRRVAAVDDEFWEEACYEGEKSASRMLLPKNQ